MKTGMILKKTLGLEKFKYVKVARALVSAVKILFVWYDSRRPSIPLTKWKITKFPWSTMAWNGTELLYQHTDRAKVPFAPPLDIRDYNGELRGTVVISVDLVGQNTIDKKVFSTKLEFIGGLKPHKRLQEITLPDLMKSQGMSDFTQTFRKERNKLVGAEANIAKLLDADLDASGTLTFTWLTEPTEPKYPDDMTYYNTNDSTFALHPEPSKTYELKIAIDNFMDWFDTVPDKTQVSATDIKDIFDIADIRVWSNDPSFHWQGANFWISQLGGSLYPTGIKPEFWNAPNLHGEGNALLSKHLGGLINGIKFWYQPMASMTTKVLKSAGLLTN